MAILKTAQDFRQRENDIYINPHTGDFEISPSDNQHVQDVLQSEPGWWKEFPSVGAGVRRLLKGRVNIQRVESVIKQQLEGDGYQVSRANVTITANGDAVINPNAKRVKF